MAVRKPNAIAYLAAALLSSGLCPAATAPRLSGSIIGFVSDSVGVPQMGATVMLFNRYDRLLFKAVTNEKGSFGFDFLSPDTYSIRVSLVNFVPALKANILVQPGMRNFLTVNLASIFSSIELVYSAPAGPVMSDDWKWVLRSSASTRPVLRILPQVDISAPPDSAQTPSRFSGTRGVVRVSAGDEGSGGGVSPDLGTSFALATSVFGNNQVQLSGNVGYSSASGAPAAGFRTRFSHGDGPGLLNPEVQLTMRQLFVPTRAGGGLFSGRADNNTPILRTMAISFQDKVRVMDDLLLEYGATLETIQYLDRLNYASPYARLTYDLGDKGQFEIGYSSGEPPTEFSIPGSGTEAALQRDLAAVSMFPRLTMRDGHVHMQRSNNIEIGYQYKAGSRTYSVGAYHETISNAALMMSSENGVLPATSDVLPDAFSNSAIFNIGNLYSTGFTASVSQEVTDYLTVTVAYGDGGVLRTEGRELLSGTPDELRSMIRSNQQQWLTTRVSGSVPRSGTRFISSYLWTDYRALTPSHRYITQGAYPETGLNIYIRQPIPGVPGVPGRLEATADLRNMMAQGYLPISSGTGQRLLLIHSPRSVRGGLSFIF